LKSADKPRIVPRHVSAVLRRHKSDRLITPIRGCAIR
jgi:hypothetical protein